MSLQSARRCFFSPVAGEGGSRVERDGTGHPARPVCPAGRGSGFSRSFPVPGSEVTRSVLLFAFCSPRYGEKLDASLDSARFSS